jgi:membrane protein insertase Oxa1/YidC/SpoIIIJ
MWQDKKDKAHELAVMQLQIQSQEKIGAQRLEEVKTTAESAEMQALYESAKITPSGVKWVDATLALLIGSVRPILSYAFFALYATVKYAQATSVSAFYSNITWTTALAKTWTEEDSGLFACMIAFWFGNRAATKFFKK